MVGAPALTRRQHGEIPEFGPDGEIRMIEPGRTFQYRSDLRECGLHITNRAGIDYNSKNDDEPAFSIVMSGGYVDDKDNGDTM